MIFLATCNEEKCSYHGSCIATSDFKTTYYCVCHEGWSGLHCEIEHKFAIGIWIFVVVFLGIISILLASALIFLIRK